MATCTATAMPVTAATIAPERHARGRRRPRVLVAGLGNLLLKDDGVGVHAVRALAGRLPRDVQVADVGTAVLDALHLFEWADRILAIDAMQAGGAPGTVYAFTEKDVLDGGPRASLHEMGLVAVLRFLRRPPPEVAILGVEPETIDFGLELSPAVGAALPRVIEAAQAFVARWRASAPVTASGGACSRP